MARFITLLDKGSEFVVVAVDQIASIERGGKFTVVHLKGRREPLELVEPFSEVVQELSAGYMPCSSCVYWERGSVAREKGGIVIYYGECRRRAPTSTERNRATFPSSMSDDWCGEHERDVAGSFGVEDEDEEPTNETRQ